MDALRGNKPANEELTWTAERVASFLEGQGLPQSGHVVGPPQPDGSPGTAHGPLFFHVGVALHQRLKDHSTWQPLGFFSKKLEVGQAKWSAFYRELLACVEGIRHFRFILEGRAFTIYTGHKPLVGALDGYWIVDSPPVPPSGIRGEIYG
jgi:hypothetical protein